MSETRSGRNAGISVKVVRLLEVALRTQSTAEPARSVSLGIVQVPNDLDAPGRALTVLH